MEESDLWRRQEVGMNLEEGFLGFLRLIGGHRHFPARSPAQGRRRQSLLSAWNHSPLGDFHDLAGLAPEANFSAVRLAGKGRIGIGLWDGGHKLKGPGIYH